MTTEIVGVCACVGLIFVWTLWVWYLLRWLRQSNEMLLKYLGDAQNHVSRTASEMLAFRTLLQTGDQLTAGKILQHSRASEVQPQHTQGQFDPATEEAPIGPNAYSPDILFGEEAGDPVPAIEET